MGHLRDVLSQGRPAFGVWLVMSSATSAEVIGALGFDYLGIDVQHGLLAYEGMRDILLATSERAGTHRTVSAATALHARCSLSVARRMTSTRTSSASR